ncbi:hypothetical protein BZZ01_30070 [Nostocales cyanobacterium HT-58-2]|nr:hypothetical protein BZZ01_30070 [Nostocales cyanobacterium HT-58-2]
MSSIQGARVAKLETLLVSESLEATALPTEVKLEETFHLNLGEFSLFLVLRDCTCDRAVSRLLRSK